MEKNFFVTKKSILTSLMTVLSITPDKIEEFRTILEKGAYTAAGIGVGALLGYEVVRLDATKFEKVLLFTGIAGLGLLGINYFYNDFNAASEPLLIMFATFTPSVAVGALIGLARSKS